MIARASAGVMSAARAVVSASTAASAAAALMHLHLGVPIVPFIVACVPNDTVSAFRTSCVRDLDHADWSSRTLGQCSSQAGFHLPRLSSRDGNHGARHQRKTWG